jgi:hypothetical protein
VRKPNVAAAPNLGTGRPRTVVVEGGYVGLATAPSATRMPVMIKAMAESGIGLYKTELIPT